MRCCVVVVVGDDALALFPFIFFLPIHTHTHTKQDSMRITCTHLFTYFAPSHVHTGSLVEGKGRANGNDQATFSDACDHRRTGGRNVGAAARKSTSAQQKHKRKGQQEQEEKAYDAPSSALRLAGVCQWLVV